MPVIGVGVGIPFRKVSGESYPSVLDDGNTVGWYDYLLGITKSSNRVSGWADQSGSGEDFAQADGGKQPLLQSTGILFNGSDEVMATVGFTPTLEQPLTVYMVAKQVSWTQNDYFYSGLGVSFGLVQYSAANEILGYAGLVGTDESWALDSFGVITNIYHGAFSSIQVNDGTIVTSNVGGNDPGGLVLGASNTQAAGFINCEIKALIVRKISDSEANRTEIREYLNSKYGL